ncbi:MAG: hypothetical protein KF880_10385 [Ferruginibacter sp.]|nr:hypothetical protein [Ferruginibacter sp.]
MKPCIASFGILLLVVLSVLNTTGQTHGTLKFTLIHTANGKPVELNTTTYNTPNGEEYTIKKLRYYFSNFKFPGNPTLEDADNYQLIDQARSTSFSIPVLPGKYTHIEWLLGIDSLRHCSGAQEGALDPMNDMFWTWNTGYVVFKLDGTSTSSTADRNRIEHHIGGFRFGQNVSTPLSFELPNDRPLEITAGKTTEITLHLNLDRYWKSKETILIARESVCTVPDALARKIASNFPYLFEIEDIKVHEN